MNQRKRKLPPTDARALIDGIYANELTSGELLAALSQHEMDWTYEHEGYYSHPTFLITLACAPRLCTNEIVKIIMQKVPDNVIVLQTTDVKRTALHFAAISNNFLFVSGLLSRNSSSDFVDLLDTDQCTAMERAVGFDQKEVVEVFLRHRLLSDRIYSLACDDYHSMKALPVIVSAAIPTCEDLPKLMLCIQKRYRDTRDYNYLKPLLSYAMRQLDIAIDTQKNYDLHILPFVIQTTTLLRDLVLIIADYARIKTK